MHFRDSGSDEPEQNDLEKQLPMPGLPRRAIAPDRPTFLALLPYGFLAARRFRRVWSPECSLDALGSIPIAAIKPIGGTAKEMKPPQVFQTTTRFGTEILHCFTANKIVARPAGIVALSTDEHADDTLSL